MDSKEAIERQIKALEHAEAHAKTAASYGPVPKVWIRIARGWDSLTYRLEDTEQMEQRKAENAAKMAALEKGEGDEQVQPSD
jgi:hypothetical protein